MQKAWASGMVSPLCEKEMDCCVTGYHVYKEMWRAAVGEVCKREPTNVVDRYAVVVVKNEIVIGHLPRGISKVCSKFLSRGGLIRCPISGNQRYSSDLLHGGLEVPCTLRFVALKKEMMKLKRLFNSTARTFRLFLLNVLLLFHDKV